MALTELGKWGTVLHPARGLRRVQFKGQMKRRLSAFFHLRLGQAIRYVTTASADPATALMPLRKADAVGPRIRIDEALAEHIHQVAWSLLHRLGYSGGDLE
jgi:hypothetical protein